MKQLLHIPSGIFFLFYDENIWRLSKRSVIAWSVEDFYTWVNSDSRRPMSYEDIIKSVISGDYSHDLYQGLGTQIDTLMREEFELVDV